MNGKYIIILMIFAMLAINVNADFTLSSDTLEQTVCQGNTVLFTTKVLGSGLFSVNQEGNGASFSTTVPLNAQSNGVFYTYMTPSSLTLPGNYNLNVVVNDGATVKKANYALNVQDCHAMQIKAETVKDICECGSERIGFKIKNNGKFTETYTLSLTGSGKDIAKLASDSVSLDANEEKEVTVNVDAPCNLESAFDLTLNVVSKNSDASSSFTTLINVNKCYGFDANLEKSYLSLCEKEDTSLKLDITNLGVYDNNFKIKVDGVNWINVEKNEVSILQKGKESVNLLIKPGSNIGNFTAKVKISTKDNNIVKEGELKVDIRKCYGVNLNVDSEFKVCNAFVSSKEIEVKNPGEFAETFMIKGGYDWIEEENITLQSKETKKVLLRLNPENLKEGDYRTQITVTNVKDDNLKEEKTVTITVVDKINCYGVSLTLDKNIDVKRDSSKLVTVTLKNNGFEDGKYLLELNGNTNFVQVNPSILEIEHGKSANTYLYIAPSKSVEEGVYEVILKVKLEDNTLIKEERLNIKVGTESKVVSSNTTSFWSKITGWFTFEVKNETKVQPVKTVKLNANGVKVKANTSFIIGNETHSFEIVEMDNESATIVFKSDPVVVSLDNNETIKVDLNQDGKEDVSVTYLNNEFLIKQIAEEKESFFNQRNLIIIGVIIGVLILGILLYFMIASDSEEETKEEKFELEEEEEGGYRIGRWILGLIAIGVLAYYFKDSINWKDYLLAYKNYIIIGLICLIGIVILAKYWKQINNFLDDLDEEEKKPLDKSLKRTSSSSRSLLEKAFREKQSLTLQGKEKEKKRLIVRHTKEVEKKHAVKKEVIVKKPVNEEKKRGRPKKVEENTEDNIEE
ncbi:hypothetical protein J4405_02960 [Candidatus Woesearchaeota archaeon]|nr:hypothetical protein [Candidatus Woesearchaeota archaeon]